MPKKYVEKRYLISLMKFLGFLLCFLIALLISANAQTPKHVKIKHIPYEKLGKTALNKSIYNKWSDARYVQELQSLPRGGFLKIHLKDYNDNKTPGNESLDIYVINKTNDRIIFENHTIAGRRACIPPAYLELSNNKQFYPIAECIPYNVEYLFAVVWRKHWYIFDKDGREEPTGSVPNCENQLISLISNH